MRRKLTLAAVISAVVILETVGVATATQSGPAYLVVQSQSWSAQAQNQNAVQLSATANADIPRQSDSFIEGQVIVGVAWADLDTGKALVATIHPAIGQDSLQRPDGWHLHTVQLAGGATAPNDFCLVRVVTTPTAGIRISGSTMRVNIRSSELPFTAGEIDAAVGFTVHGGDDGCVTGLGVRIRTS